MNELALFAGAGIMKSHKEASWILNGAANAVKNCCCLRFTSALAQSRTIPLARSARVLECTEEKEKA